MKKYLSPIIMLIIFESVAITLWLTKDNIFYLLNFSYIGCSIALGLTLFIKEHKYARRVTQLLVSASIGPLSTLSISATSLLRMVSVALVRAQAARMQRIS